MFSHKMVDFFGIRDPQRTGTRSAARPPPTAEQGFCGFVWCGAPVGHTCWARWNARGARLDKVEAQTTQPIGGVVTAQKASPGAWAARRRGGVARRWGRPNFLGLVKGWRASSRRHVAPQRRCAFSFFLSRCSGACLWGFLVFWMSFLALFGGVWTFFVGSRIFVSPAAHRDGHPPPWESNYGLLFADFLGFSCEFYREPLPPITLLT